MGLAEFDTGLVETAKLFCKGNAMTTRHMRVRSRDAEAPE
jgi:hypothetical protein